MAPRKLFVCSIGNPGSYMGTRHSAGHTVNALIQEEFKYPKFASESDGLLSPGGYDARFTLFQSQSLMNISGRSVKKAWGDFRKQLDSAERDRALLVVLHDELEKPLGEIKVKATGSAGGHNGLTSIISHLGTKDFYRIGVGIGRPNSRSSAEVSKYVLSRFTSFEKQTLAEKTLPKILKALKFISKA